MAIDQVARQLAARALQVRSAAAQGLDLDETLSIEGAAPDAKAVGDALNELKEKIFIGSKAQYNLAFKEGKIPNGTIVILTNDAYIDDDDASSSILGTGVLGYMILG